MMQLPLAELHAKNDLRLKTCVCVCVPKVLFKDQYGKNANLQATSN